MDAGGSSQSTGPGAMGIRQLREELRSRGVDTSGCLYKADLVALLLENLALAPEITPCPTEPQPGASGEEEPPQCSAAGRSCPSRSGAGALNMELDSMCQTCFKHGEGVKLLKCSKCKAAHYCGRECQVTGWPAHKPLCQKNQKMKQLASEAIGPETYEAFEAWVKRLKAVFSLAAAAALLPSRSETHVVVLHIVRDQQQGAQVPTFSVLPEYETITIAEAHARLASRDGLLGGGPPLPSLPGRMLVFLESNFRVRRVIPFSLPPDRYADIRSGKEVLHPPSAYIELINSRVF